MVEHTVVKIDFGTEGNEINVTTTVTLTEEDAIDYMELDELVREGRRDLDSEVSRRIGDILSDHGWSYSNDILGTMNWNTLEDVLILVRWTLDIN